VKHEVWYYDEPRRADILCEHCVEEIEAYGEEVVSMIIYGSRPYLWRHVSTGSVNCVVNVPTARPYDDFAAHRRLKDAGLS
jgi:hypothetical protein